jgi:flagellar hook assembly protein FlgD
MREIQRRRSAISLLKAARWSAHLQHAGQKVRTLVSGDQPAGSYVRIWDGRDDQGRNVASGIYLYQLTSGSFRQVKKLVLMR